MSLPSYLQSLESVLGAPVSSITTTTGVPVAPSLPTFLTSADLAKGLTTSNGGSTAGKLKFLFVGTHCQQVTGYSKVTYGY